MARLPVDVKLARMLVAAHAAGLPARGHRDRVLPRHPGPARAPGRGARRGRHRARAVRRSEFGVRRRAQAVGGLPRRARGPDAVEAARLVREDISSASCACASGASCIGSCCWCARSLGLGTLQRQAPARVRRPLAPRADRRPADARSGHKAEKGLYDAPRQRKFQLFPGSALAKAAAGLGAGRDHARHARVWGLMARAHRAGLGDRRTAAPARAQAFRSALVARAGPRASARSRSACSGWCWRRRSPVHYGGLYPAEAREIFVRQALLPGEINTRAAFVARNLATLEKAREEEAKLRRAGLVADEDWQARWYLDRLPAGDQLASRRSTAGTASCRRTSARRWSGRWPTCCRARAARPIASRNTSRSATCAWRCTTASSPAPTTTASRSTCRCTCSSALDAARLSWLVPGLVEEKAAALIRSLPKALRRNYVPAPDFARAFVQAHPQRGGRRARRARWRAS